MTLLRCSADGLLGLSSAGRLAEQIAELMWHHSGRHAAPSERRSWDRSLPDLPLTTMAKVFTAETIYRVTKDAAECFGAMGVMRDMPLQRYIHDAMICLHTGDGNSDDKLRIAEALAGHRSAAPLLAAE